MQSHWSEEKRSLSGIAETHTNKIILSDSMNDLLEATKQQSGKFIKLKRNFSQENIFNIPDKGQHHSAHISKKKPKNTANSTRDINEWIRISTTRIFPQYTNRANWLYMVAGEIYRFEIGDTQPKYRIVQHPNRLTEIITKKIPQATEFFEYFFEKIHPDLTKDQKTDSIVYKGNIFFEGIARCELAKWLYLENDGSSGNSLLNAQQYFVAIDFAQSFWPIAAKFYVHQSSEKITDYPVTREDLEVKRIETTDNHPPHYQIKGKTYEYIGELHPLDYKNLPVIQYLVPKSSDFMGDDITPYAQKLAQTQQFNNERHFAAFKALTTTFIKKYIVEYHYREQADKQHDRCALHAILSKQFEAFTNICKQSDEFKEYIQNNYFSAAKATIYEVRQFFDENKHYFPKDTTLWLSLWKSIAKDLLQETHEFLSSILTNKEPGGLTREEMRELTQFAEQCQTSPESILPEVADFYADQLMRFHEKNCRSKLAKLSGRKEEYEHQEVLPVRTSSDSVRSCYSPSFYRRTSTDPNWPVYQRVTSPKSNSDKRPSRCGQCVII